jgi:methyltransferase (TIGR00027 family)
MKEGVPSATARLIAAATVMAATEPGLRDLAPARAVDWSQRFLSVRPQDRRLLWSVRSRACRWAWRLAERATLPGLARHWLVRKAWIEREWRGAAQRGFSQLIVLGAGLDTLGVRVAEETPGMRVIELDHPATQGLKRAALAGASPVMLLPCQIGAQRVSDVLATTRAADGFDPARATMIVCEGVLMYLSDAEVEALVADVAGLPVARLKVVFTAMDKGGGRARFAEQRGVVNWWLRRRGEPFRSGSTPELMCSLLGRHGFRGAECKDIAAADPGGWSGHVLRGELLALGERGG